jgi:hypothetical protein
MARVERGGRRRGQESPGVSTMALQRRVAPGHWPSQTYRCREAGTWYPSAKNTQRGPVLSAFCTHSPTDSHTSSRMSKNENPQLQGLSHDLALKLPSENFIASFQAKGILTASSLVPFGHPYSTYLATLRTPISLVCLISYL